MPKLKVAFELVRPEARNWTGFRNKKEKDADGMIGSDNAQITIEAEVFDASTTIGQQKRPMIT